MGLRKGAFEGAFFWDSKDPAEARGGGDIRQWPTGKKHTGLLPIQSWANFIFFLLVIWCLLLLFYILLFLFIFVCSVLTFFLPLSPKIRPPLTSGPYSPPCPLGELTSCSPRANPAQTSFFGEGRFAPKASSGRNAVSPGVVAQIAVVDMPWPSPGNTCWPAHPPAILGGDVEENPGPVTGPPPSALPKERRGQVDPMLPPPGLNTPNCHQVSSEVYLPVRCRAKWVEVKAQRGSPWHGPPS